MSSTSTTSLQTRAERRGGRGLATAQLVLSVLAVVGMGVIMWAALVYARPAVNLQGDEQIAQRIFYVHMGCNFGALAGFLVSLVSAIMYLITRNLDWDRLEQAGIELGLAFGIGTTITGAIWAKPTWNTYWTWDPRLTTVTITVLIYVAYLLFRNGIDNRQTRARFGSIYALFAFLSLPLTYYSARWFRSIHPVVFSNDNPEGEGGFQVGATMGTTIEIAAVSFVALFSALLIMRFRQLRLQDRIEEMREDLG
jgi:heme exporter protein C